MSLQLEQEIEPIIITVIDTEEDDVNFQLENVN